jgi:cell shape-determining protein MreC
MGQDTRVSARDVGKRVVDGSGVVVGRVVEFSAGSAHVDPNPDERLALNHRCSRRDEDTYRINDEQVERITDTEVRLRS